MSGQMVVELEQAPIAANLSPIKATAVKEFVETGSLIAVAKALDIPLEILRAWELQSWWEREVVFLRAERDGLLESQLAGLMGQAVKILGDRLANGDTVVLANGDTVPRPVSARDTATIMSVALDYRKAIRTDANRGAETRSASLDKLQATLERIGERLGVREPLTITQEDSHNDYSRDSGQTDRAGNTQAGGLAHGE